MVRILALIESLASHINASNDIESAITLLNELNSLVTSMSAAVAQPVIPSQKPQG